MFIKNIIPGSPADKCNVLQVGDRILAVDETNLKDASHQYAVTVIKNAGLKIRLVVERFHKWVGGASRAARNLEHLSAFNIRA